MVSVQQGLRRSPYDCYIICDGGNDRRGCYGSYIIYKGDDTIAEESQHNYPDLSTNNEAEYMALIRALERLLQVEGPHTNILVMSDSELMVNQTLGYFACEAPNLIPLRERALTLLNKSNNWYLIHISGRVMKRILGH